jgi:hypothetical protein
MRFPFSDPPGPQDGTIVGSIFGLLVLAWSLRRLGDKLSAGQGK